MELFIDIVTFIISIAVLVKASDYFIKASETIGVSLGIPHFIVGVFVVGFGTSFPELVSSVVAVRHGSTEIVIGNVLGSNIANTLLVMGVAAVIGKKFRIGYNLRRFDLPMLLGSSFILAFMIWDGKFGVLDALVSFLCISIYFFTLIRNPQAEENRRKGNPGAKAWLLLLLSPVLVFLGAKYTIESVLSISKIMGIGTEVIALSAVALGTSLPEVVVSFTAVRRGNPEMAIGNIIGSNLFNTYAVMGISALFGTLTIPKSVLEFSLPVSILATIIFVIVMVDQKINRWEGFFLLASYLFFITKLFVFV